jgi:hypothetical protein
MRITSTITGCQTECREDTYAGMRYTSNYIYVHMFVCTNSCCVQYLISFDMI